MECEAVLENFVLAPPLLYATADKAVTRVQVLHSENILHFD